jgi:hypothetical protein
VKKLSALALALVSLLWLTGATWLPLFVATASFATWNTTDSSATVTRSNGNLTLTDASGSGFVGVKATHSHSTGKFYFEVTTNTNNGSMQFGIANSSYALGSLAGSGQAVGFDTGGGVFIGGVSIGTGASFSAATHTLSIAVDFGNATFWFRVDAGNWNNSGTANPATNAGGFSISTLPAVAYFPASAPHDVTDALTANFGATSYAQSVPAGFSNW